MSAPASDDFPEEQSGSLSSYIITSCLWTALSFIIILTFLWKWSTTCRFLMKYFYFYFGFVQFCCCCTLLSCVYRGGRSLKNNNFMSWIVKQVSFPFGLTLEEQGKENIKFDTPCVLLSNHQSLIDVVTLLNIKPDKTAFTGKKELKYMGLFGALFYLCGNVLLDRFNRTKAVEKMNKVGEEMKQNKLKLHVFPEGTRVMKKDDLGAFKKGAFHIAIQNQVPIVPLVLSSYSNFLDFHGMRFDSGLVIARYLEPIPTKGLTTENLDELIARTRTVMVEAFREVTHEVQDREKKTR